MLLEILSAVISRTVLFSFIAYTLIFLFKASITGIEPRQLYGITRNFKSLMDNPVLSNFSVGACDKPNKIQGRYVDARCSAEYITPTYLEK